MAQTQTRTEWNVTVDHGYDGEQERTFDSKEAAETFANERRFDHYVMRVWVEEINWTLTADGFWTMG